MVVGFHPSGCIWWIDVFVGKRGRGYVISVWKGLQ